MASKMPAGIRTKISLFSKFADIFKAKFLSAASGGGAE
jgi:hypothetical protein